MSEFIANIIAVLHFLFICFISLGWLSNKPIILIAHAFICFFLMVHWLTKSDMCALTLLESYFRDIPHDDTFMKQLVSPLYVITNKQCEIISWIVVIIVMCISISKIYKSDVLPVFFECMKTIYNSSELYNTKMKMYMDCLQKLN